MFEEFKAFIARGNVLDLAVAVVIGAAFGSIVASVTDDIIMPIIGAVTGGMDYSSKFILIGSLPNGYSGAPTDYVALKKAGAVMIGYGKFITAIINFLIISAVIFLIVRTANKLKKEEAVAPAAPTPSEVLLAEIRDALKARQP
jgi:large conductance mechanosensitive channel